ncbi:MAG TPA: pyruvate kinase [Candidatus Saccharimonadales bacterium]|jgi:pyruvate kinase
MSMIFKRAKIIATVGPSTNSYESIEKMIKAGVNGFRLNFSHGTFEERDQQIVWIRTASQKLNKPVAIIQDLQGPKIRLGEIIDNRYDVTAGDKLTLVYGGAHVGTTVPVQYDLSQKVSIGERLYIFDGKIRTTVTATNPDEKSVTVNVENDGFLMSRKGLNLPDTDFGGDILTEKDYKDMDYGAKTDFDYVALSFIQTARDVETARGYLAKLGSTAHIITKVETRAAIDGDELEHIVEASDGVMVARGDLAVEVGAEQVPIVQRTIIGLCQKYGKISVVATQMMASMVDSPEPTRAEISDIANAVIVGADCLMLSDETANGHYPLEAIASMKRAILYTQEHAPVRPLDVPQATGVQAAVCSSAKTLASQAHAVAIIAETRSGATAAQIAAHRPSRPIISVTSEARVAQQLAILYANKSFLRDDGERAGLELAKELITQGFLESPSTVVLVSGRQPGLIGGTDTIRVRTL